MPLRKMTGIIAIMANAIQRCDFIDKFFMPPSL
jgi:hypothetical protein